MFSSITTILNRTCTLVLDIAKCSYVYYYDESHKKKKKSKNPSFAHYWMLWASLWYARANIYQVKGTIYNEAPSYTLHNLNSGLCPNCILETDLHEPKMTMTQL